MYPHRTNRSISDFSPSQSRGTNPARLQLDCNLVRHAFMRCSDLTPRPSSQHGGDRRIIFTGVHSNMFVRVRSGSTVSKRQPFASELHRIRFECHAIEEAPEHDEDKALLTSAPAWERSSLRVGPWPRERKIPVFSHKLRVKLYDRQCKLQQSTRRQRGLAFRDFESPVFTVPKKMARFDCVPITVV